MLIVGILRIGAIIENKCLKIYAWLATDYQWKLHVYTYVHVCLQVFYRVIVVKRRKVSCLSVVCVGDVEIKGLPLCILSAMNALLCLAGRHIQGSVF